MSANLGERAVACPCDARFHWPILVEGTGENSRVTGCLHCGTVTYALAGVDEPRAGDIRFHGYYTGEIEPHVLEWLAEWPRVRTDYGQPRWPMSSQLVRRDKLYLPADTRCGTLEELDRLVAEAERRDAGLRSGQRLMEAGWPKAPPPEGMPGDLHRYRQTWEALQLGPRSPVEQLVRTAQLSHDGSAVAVEWLLQRADSAAILRQALTSSDQAWWSAGYAMARDQRPVEPELPGLLIELLGGLSLEKHRDVPDRIASCGRCEALLVLIADLRLNSPQMLAELERLKKRIGRRDWSLVKYIGLVVRELR